MTTKCCAFTHCTNNGTKIQKWKRQFCDIHQCNKGTGRCVCEPPFYLFPFPTVNKDNNTRLKWTAIVNRKDGQENWTPKEYSRICSTHFVDGKPTIKNPYPTLNLGYTPYRPICSRDPPKTRIFIETPSKKRKTQSDNDKCICDIGQENVQVLHEHDYSVNQEINCNSCQLHIVKINQLEEKIKNLEQKLLISKKNNTSNNHTKESIFKIATVLKSDKSVKFYTGIPSLEAFNVVYTTVEPHLKHIRYWKGPKRMCNPLKPKNKFHSEKRHLTAKQELIMTLMKLRLGLLNEDIANRFGVSQSHVSSIFVTWVKILSSLLSSLIFNPPSEIVKANLPPSFKNAKYGIVRHIIDCTEVFVEKPNNLEAAALTWSDYKNHNTAKFLVSITPAGMINYVSKCCGGRASDKFITLHSGFMDIVEPYDKVMADKGFQMREDFALLNAELMIPPGRRGVAQMSRKDVRCTSEQAIRRMKKFKKGIATDIDSPFRQHS